MEVTINYNGQAVAVEVTLEVYEFLDRADHKTENLFHEQRRHWDGREFDEYIITTEGVGVYGETPEEYLCRMETLHELMAVLDTCHGCVRVEFDQDFHYCTGEVCHTPKELFDLLADDYRTYLEIELTKGRRELTENDEREADALCKRHLERWKEKLE